MKQHMRIDDRSIVTVREFAYPVERVWRMWTEPERIALWFGPDGFSTTTKHFQFSVGGEWAFVMRGPDGTLYPNEVTFQAIEPQKLIHYVKKTPPFFETFVEFQVLGPDSTQITFTQVFGTKEERNSVAVYAEPANAQFMRKLDRAIAAPEKQEY